MASSLATSRIENGGLRSYALSLGGHLLLAAALFFIPGPREKFFMEEVPRSVKLIATLDIPTPPPVTKPVRKVRAKPEKPAPPPPPAPARKPAKAPPPVPARSRIQVPVRKAPPLIKPRTAPASSPSLKEKLSSRLSTIDSTPAPTPGIEVPDLEMPKIAAVPKPAKLPSPTASSRDLVPLSNFPYSWYIAVVKDRVYSRWNPPSTFVLGGRKSGAVATFRIMKNGRVLQISLKESSGHRLFDQSAMAALTTLKDLPPLPADFKEDHLDVVMRFQNPNH